MEHTFWSPDQMEGLDQAFLNHVAKQHKDKINSYDGGHYLFICTGSLILLKSENLKILLKISSSNRR